MNHTSVELMTKQTELMTKQTAKAGVKKKKKITDFSKPVETIQDISFISHVSAMKTYSDSCGQFVIRKFAQI